MLRSPLSQLKVPEQLFKKANERGLFSLLQYWYKLKCLNIEGYFKGNYTSFIAQKLNISIKTAYAIIAKMIELKWIVKQSNGISLVKYDLLWKHFDLVRSYTSKFKIFKVQSTLKYFVEYVAAEEIRLNLQRQNYVLDKKINKLNAKLKVTLDADKKLIESELGILYDVTLSCRGIARLLGFKSPSIAYKLEQSLYNLGIISIQKRKDTRGLNNSNIISFI